MQNSFRYIKTGWDRVVVKRKKKQTSQLKVFSSETHGVINKNNIFNIQIKIPPERLREFLCVFLLKT